MPDTPTFVVNDRRKFNADGEPRHEPTDSPDAAHDAGRSPGAERERTGPQLISFPEPSGSPTVSEELADLPEAGAVSATGLADQEFAPADEAEHLAEDTYPPGPTTEQSAEAARAYAATVDRLDTALRAADPGGERMPEMSFERLTQSLYTQALLMLGGATQPGETPRVDILGARQTVDMLAVIAEKTQGNLSADEDKLLQSALFDLRMGFLEITQALARQAQQRQGASPGTPPMGGAGPRIVR